MLYNKIIYKIMNVKAIFSHTVFNLKFFINNKKKVSFFIVPIILSLILAIIFFPISLGFSIIVETGLIMSEGIIFMSLSGNFRNSSLYKNIEPTKLNKFNFNISIYILMITSSIIILFLLMTSLIILSPFNIIETGWLSYDKTLNYKFLNKNVSIVFLSMIEMTTILFVISYLFIQISNSQKNYYMLMFSFVILNVIFGATINSYFWAQYLNPVTSFGEPVSKFKEYSYMSYSPAIFPSWTFWISLLYPFYAPGQLLIIYGQKSLVESANGVTSAGSEWGNVISLQWQTVHNTPQWYQSSIWRWNITLLMPLIQIITLSSLGIIASSSKK